MGEKNEQKNVPLTKMINAWYLLNVWYVCSRCSIAVLKERCSIAVLKEIGKKLVGCALKPKKAESVCELQ